MAQTINTNVASLNAQRNLSSSQSSLGTTLQRLSSGLRVNSAKDDAAGLAIAERMNTQVRGMNVAIRNSNDAISMTQTAEGALTKVGDSLQRMRELAVQSRNATNTDEDRGALQKEFAELQAEIGRLTAGTEFNGKKVIGSGAGSMVFQVGAGTGSNDQIKVTTTDLSGASAITDVTGSGAKIGGTTTTGSGSAAVTTAVSAGDIKTVIDNLDAAITTINNERAMFGAVQNRFESVIANLQTSVENTAAARGRIMDADFATETANLSRTQILQQAGTAMLAQANSLPQNVLSLLR